MRRKLTLAEQEAYRTLARAAQRLRQVTARAEARARRLTTFSGESRGRAGSRNAETAPPVAEPGARRKRKRQ